MSYPSGNYVRSDVDIDPKAVLPKVADLHRVKILRLPQSEHDVFADVSALTLQRLLVLWRPFFDLLF